MLHSLRQPPDHGRRRGIRTPIQAPKASVLPLHYVLYIIPHRAHLLRNLYESVLTIKLLGPRRDLNPNFSHWYQERDLNPYLTIISRLY